MWEVYGILAKNPEVDPQEEVHDIWLDEVCGDRTPEGDGMDDLGRWKGRAQLSINQRTINLQMLYEDQNDKE